MNAVNLLGSLLGNNATGGSVGQKVLGSILSSGGGGGGGGGALGTLLGGSGGGGGGALGALLGAAMKNGGGGSRGGGGGDIAGQILGSILSGGKGQAQNSGAAGLLGGLLGGGAAQPQPQRGGGGIGGLLGGLLGGKKQQQPQTRGGGDPVADLLGGLLGGAQKPTPEAHAELGRQAGNILDDPPREAQDEATVLIRAMLNSAKSDGNFDKDEQEKILSRLGDVSQEELNFIKEELAQPLDLEGFIREVPRGLEQQAYAFSVMGIKLDTQGEANYLGKLAQGMGLKGDECNAINKQLGAPEIFS